MPRKSRLSDQIALLLPAPVKVNGDPFGAIGNLSPGQRIKRGRTGKITEDDPRFNPKTMGNRKGR